MSDLGQEAVDPATGINTVLLPFVVRIVRTEEHLQRAVAIRVKAYSRHLPGLASALREPEPEDRSRSSLVLLAETKEGGEPIATMRIETNFDRPLGIEEVLKGKPQFAGRTIANVSRLGVASGREGALAKLTLFKALHRYCLATQVEWIVVGAKPPLDRQYERLGFIDVEADGSLRPIPASQGIPVRLLALEVIAAEREWLKGGHPLYKFMCQDFTPDIQIFSSVSGMWATPRRRVVEPPSDALLESVFGVSLV